MGRLPEGWQTTQSLRAYIRCSTCATHLAVQYPVGVLLSGLIFNAPRWPGLHVTQPSLAAHAALPQPWSPAQFCFQLQAVSSTRLSWSRTKKRNKAKLLKRRWEGKHEEPSTHVASPRLRLCKAVLPSAARPQNIKAPQRAERGRPPAARQGAQGEAALGRGLL